jgi:hypothetical protein
MFLLSCATLAYAGILEDQSHWPWLGLGASAILLVWTNYFGLVLLILLCADLILFHRKLARRRAGFLSAICVSVVVSFIPLVKAAAIAIQSGRQSFGPMDSSAALAYAVYSIFATVAIAPWYWPLSVPVGIAAILLVISVWLGPGRRWMAYFSIALLLLAASNHLTIKRIVFLLPWFFLAIAVAVSSQTSRFPKTAVIASTLLIFCGLLGIESGRHYSSTNLYEPWKQVSHIVARDARQGATLISVNPPFFLYLNYELGLQTEMQGAGDAYLGEGLYRRHGYSILEPDAGLARAQKIHGKVVMVQGPALVEDVDAMETLNAEIAQRCSTLGEFRAAPDPAIAWKRRFTKHVDLLSYRTQVTWYDCP